MRNRGQEKDKPVKKRTNVFMPPELTCYNEGDNLVVGMLSIAWCHFLLRKKAIKQKVADMYHQEFLLRHE